MMRWMLGVTLLDKRRNSWLYEKLKLREVRSEAVKRKWLFAKKIATGEDTWAKKIVEWHPWAKTREEGLHGETNIFLFIFTISLTVIQSYQSPCKPEFSGNLPISPCSREYSICVNGVHQRGQCSEGHVFHDGRCLLEEESAECSISSKFDCSGREDGVYTLGCLNHYITCVAERSISMKCPVGLLYVESANACLESCDATLPTSIDKDSELSRDDSYEPGSENALFDCSGLPDGLHASGCSRFYFHCSNGDTFTMYCPESLVFSPNTGNCDRTCDSTTEYPASDVSSEVPYVQTSTLSLDESTTTTAILLENTSQQACTNGVVSPIGKCSSKFVRCRDNVLEEVQCPSNTVFDTDVLLCVYELPECMIYNDVTGSYSPSVNYLESPFDTPRKRDYEKPLVYSKNPYARDQTALDNPFFVHSGGYRSQRYDSERAVQSPFSVSDRGSRLIENDFADAQGVRRGKLPHGKKHKVSNGGFAYVEDEFRSSRPGYGAKIYNKYSKSNDEYEQIQSEEPVWSNEVSKSAIEEDISNDSLNELNQNSLIQSKSAVLDVEGSGEEIHRRKRRSYNYNDSPRPYRHTYAHVCRSSGRAVAIGLGQCRQDFVYCSVYGWGKKAACPVGDVFDVKESRCVSAQVCGVPISVLAINNPTSPITTPLNNIEAPLTVAPGASSTSSWEVAESSTGAPASASEDLRTTASASVDGYESTTTTPVETNTYLHQETSSQETGFQSSTSTDISLVSIREDSPTQHNICANVPDGPIAIRKCSEEFVHCTNGYAVRQKCPAGLVFDDSRALCDYKYKTGGCGVVEVVATDTVVPQPGHNPCAGKPDGIYAESCSKSYASCYGGQVSSISNCPPQLRFNTATSSCSLPAENSACSAYQEQEERNVTLGSIVSGSTAGGPQNYSSTYSSSSDNNYQSSTPSSYKETMGSIVEEREEVENLSEGEESSATPLDDEADSKCTPGTTSALGFCFRAYLRCTPKNVFSLAQCPMGKNFDETTLRCVLFEKCGKVVRHQEASTRPTLQDRACTRLPDNATVSLGVCRSSYSKCLQGKPYKQYCYHAEVYSDEQKKCVSREAAYCKEPSPTVVHVPRYSESHNTGDGFCRHKRDGLYRNPGDCSGILHCFGGDVFEYPSCPVALSFNEKTGKCDYKHNVEGCSAGEEEECSRHGAFIADPEDCSTFYRCVWGRRVQMTCPSGTLFNPSLSVCDWPSEVKSCSKSLH
ncbi:unnamed protein product [Caenorhabditis auriculariae]|uniref:Chitin-binding type-2 domain-containing protein n=1 Tax=Caenorhabditis auriculariae TaxID=2777116 RepID=A0A8S1HV36_9PELO|nr:unnamed protein product [Caenorhabditis auriculariae]